MEKTKLVTVGTPVNFGDLLEKLEKNPAYQLWKKPALNEKGEPMFPYLWGKKALDLKREEMGSLNFAREYLLERVDPATQPFKSEFVTLYDTPPPNFVRVVTVCDPAYSEKDGDASAIVTVGFTGGNHAYVLQAKEIRREDPGMVVDELFKAIDAYNPRAVGIERRKGEAVSYSFNERRTRENRWDFAYIELSHGGANKAARANMVGGLVPRWEARAVHVQRNDSRLLQQLYRFRFDDQTKGHDDLVDALAYCFHPDMAKPNTGKMNKRLPESRRHSKSFISLGQVLIPSSKDSPFDALGKRLDRRIYDAA